MRRHIAIRIGGWLLSAAILFGLNFLAATFLDNTACDGGTKLQQTAVWFIFITIWLDAQCQTFLGGTSAGVLTYLIEGAVFWETACLVRRMIHRKAKRNAN
jgi:hypothetical protein